MRFPRIIKRTPEYDNLYVKRSIVKPVMKIKTEDFIKALPDIFSLTPEVKDYAMSVTCEPSQMPIPHTFELNEQHSRIKDLFSSRYESFLKYMLNGQKIEIQAVERRSRIGYPYLSFMTEGSSKRDLIVSLHKDKNLLEKSRGPVILNKRLQPEPLNKARTFQFLDINPSTNEGVCTERTVSKEYRKTEFDGVYGSRPRLVFNYPVPTLVNQLVDGFIHDSYMSFRCFHHDMTTFPYDTKDESIISEETDIAHYERYLGVILGDRANIIGGRYSDYTKFLLSQNFIVKGSDNCTYELDYTGLPVQLGSGISAVAPAGKELNLIAITEAYARVKGVTFIRALDTLANHKDPDFIVLQFGDDEKICFRKNKSEEAMKIIEEKKKYLPSVAETPPKFLGYVKYKDENRTINRLSVKSCFLNFFLDERAPGTSFRRFPNFGYFERCNAYLKLGSKDCAEYLAKEQALLKKLGWFETLRSMAVYEKAKIKKLPLNYVLGKHYLLTKAELMALGEDTVIDAEIIKEAINLTNIVNFI